MRVFRHNLSVKYFDPSLILTDLRNLAVQVSPSQPLNIVCLKLIQGPNKHTDTGLKNPD